ncbi:hypothetical protein E0F15_10260 [Frankia sp. B2]|uniref:hypothetical protein n=1 Tax=Frankia sp. B2 TaxID=2541730 RepID=UPI00106ACB61|nr:hypothetical protein [Frankia sp. B2]TFE31150.1 hypothetical protein E0F15_10260 [Frankia sp. B2]
MLEEFWKTVGEKVADRWASIAAPALVYWLALLAVWTYHHGGLHTLSNHTSWLDRQTPAIQTLAILTALLGIAATAVLVSSAATPLLRLLEGYWPAIADPLRHRLAARAAARAAADDLAWQTAHTAVQPPNTPTNRQLVVYTRLERRRRQHPSPGAPGFFLATRTGNILRAAERRPTDKYGLDTIICWPRLWPLLPDTHRTDLAAARTALDTAATITLWALLFAATGGLYTLLAIPAGLAVATITVTVVIPARAQAFGELIEVAFDTHRTQLYTHLRWPLPHTPAEEKPAGQALTAYLWRGSDNNTPNFTQPAP